MIKNRPLVSVVVPTYGREKFHEKLYNCFSSQTYTFKELCILDDSPVPSLFFEKIEDSRVNYVHEKKRLSLGEKRNRLIEMAKGEVIAHFDDDDLYLPKYLDFMIKALGENALVKLSKWFCYDKKTNAYYYWDTSELHSSHILIDSKGSTRGINLKKQAGLTFLQDSLWGFGFSYVYPKRVYPVTSFNHQDHFGEDLHFVQKLLKRGDRCITVADELGLVVHYLHGNNLSKVFPQYELPSFLAKLLFDC